MFNKQESSLLPSTSINTQQIQSLLTVAKSTFVQQSNSTCRNFNKKRTTRPKSDTSVSSNKTIAPTKKSLKMDIASSNSNQRIAIQSLLNDDIPVGSGRSFKDYQCDQCHKIFTQRADVRKHKKTVHEKARDFHCSECKLSFGERGNLNKHVRSIHRKERNFHCNQCGATFSFRNGLTEHIRMKHTDERPYECRKCSSSFKKKSHLHRHESVVHKTTM